MHIYPDNFEQKIGFDRIKKYLYSNCLSSLGKKRIDQMFFYNDLKSLTKVLEETEEFRIISLFHQEFPINNYIDVEFLLKSIEIEGTWLDVEEFFKIRKSLEAISKVLNFFKSKDSEKFPLLKEKANKVPFDSNHISAIDSIIDIKGRVKDNASDRLFEIRTELIKKENLVARRLEQILKSLRSDNLIDKDTNYTIRDGRPVIPINSSYKRQIKGFIHDESQSGQTVYIEPSEIFDSNNEIKELKLNERREIIRLLIKLTDEIRPFLSEIRLCYDFLSYIDFTRAKANFAIEIKAVLPQTVDDNIINWQKAKHPLLTLSFKNTDRKVVPVSLELNKNNRILIISGPNAGGKSVCLKTVGLIQYMFQSGLLVPVDIDSKFGVFKKILIDIGDEQSIDNDLSTYSSHLLNMKKFLELADDKSLILIDEFGTGTEPQLGGAIAESILEKLNKNKVFGVITTHYTNLKHKANNEVGIFNGAMLYNTSKMEPLYQLQLGFPGSSFAFEIAKNIGLPDDIIDNAIEKTGTETVNMELSLRQIESEKRELEQKLKELSKADELLFELIESNKKVKEKLENEKTIIIQQAKLEAKKIIDNSNKLIENTIKIIKESQADKERTKEVRKEIEVQKAVIESEKIDVVKKIEQINNRKERKLNRKISVESERKDDFKEKILQRIKKIPQVGDSVVLQNQSTIGEILEIKSKKAFVQFGMVKMTVDLKRLEVVVKPIKKLSSINLATDINVKMSNFKPNIDVRGKRGEEVIQEVSRFIDDAILLDVKDLSILHGKGDGILRHLIRSYLSGIDHVEKFHDEHIERGGTGITIIRMK